MKLIHCADLHLDSKLTSHLSGKKRKERQAELLLTFRKMIKYADENQIDAVLIAGDLFDSNIISSDAVGTVRQVVMNYPHICFYYLKGNHDSTGFWDDGVELPDNLKLFSKSWTYYLQPGKRGQIVIAGAEITKENVSGLCDSLYLHPDAVNVVMLHGQETEYRGMDDTCVIPLRELKGKGIDYLALGHVHSYKKGRLDARGCWCYPGCLEGRGFDESGEHGFVLLDIDEETGICETEFVPFACRQLCTVYVDVTGCCGTEEIGNQIEYVLKRQGWESRNMLKLVLTGRRNGSCERNLNLLTKRFEQDCFFLKIYDETRLEFGYEDYLLEESLKGEYVRSIKDAPEIPEDEKAILIRYGIQALAGEELD